MPTAWLVGNRGAASGEYIAHVQRGGSRHSHRGAVSAALNDAVAERYAQFCIIAVVLSIYRSHDNRAMYSQIDNEETEYVFPSVGLCRCYCYGTVPLTETNIIGV